MFFRSVRFLGVLSILLTVAVLLTMTQSADAKKKKITLKGVKSIAILPFTLEIPSNEVKEPGNVIMISMIDGMKKKCKFTITDPEAMLEALKSIKRSGPHWSDKEAAAVGKTLGVDAVFVGRVSDLEEDDDKNDDGLGNIVNVHELDIEVKIRIIRSETAEELAIVEMDENRRDTRRDPMMPVTHKELMERCANGMGKKLRKQVICE